MHVDEKLTNETFPAEPEKATLEGKNKFVGFGYFLEAKQYCSLPYLTLYLALRILQMADQHLKRCSKCHSFSL